MPKFKDITGQQFGRLTVLTREEPYSYPVKWICQCECGNAKAIKGASLVQGLTQSCGCLKNENLVGKKINYLTVVELLDVRARNRQKVYRCLCDCGNYINVRSSDLKTGNTKSCGCYNKQLSHDRYIDISGQRFGNLTVIEIGNGSVEGVLYWKCQCDCGNVVNVPSRNLRDGHTTSCGCIKSKGEQKIIQILKCNNINFKTNYTFDDFRFDITNGIPRYDFGILLDNNKLKYLIEYDGIQHFDALGGWNDKESFHERHSRDIQKNKYCLHNNIPLIRIPYWHYDDLCLEDLLIETTKFNIDASSMKEAEEVKE